MDLTHDLLRKERVRLAWNSQGAVSYSELEAMPWDEYEDVRKEIVRLVERSRPSKEGKGRK